MAFKPLGIQYDRESRNEENRMLQELYGKVKVTDELIDGSFESGALDTNIKERLIQLESDFSPDLLQVKTQIKEKANQADLVIESNRINNLVANAGNTDGNSELLDIRIGFDGILYPTAGDSVRALASYMAEEGQTWEVE